MISEINVICKFLQVYCGNGYAEADDVHWIKEIIKKHEQAVHVVDLVKQNECSTSTICTTKGCNENQGY